MEAADRVHEFSTGAVRGTDVKARYDLVPTVGLRRLAETCAEGAEKYGEGNWLKGLPSSNLLSHAMAHIERWRDGDRSEDHLAHAAWGLFILMHNEERRPDMQDVHGQNNVVLSREESNSLQCLLRTPVSPDSCPDAEIDGLPSTAQPKPSPSTPVLQTPTAETLDPLDAAVEVLNRIVLDRELPNGHPVQSASWLHRTLGCSRITFRFQDRNYTVELYQGECSVVNEPQFVVEDVTNGIPAYGIVTLEISRGLREAALHRLQVSAGPSGPQEGLQQPQTPTSPMDAGWDDWVDLKTRVDNSDFRPWWDERAGWCAISPATRTVQVFGRLDSDRDVAYRWIDHLLSLRPMVENHPPSVSEPVS